MVMERGADGVAVQLQCRRTLYRARIHVIVQQLKRDVAGSLREVEMTPARPAPDVSPDRLPGSGLEATKLA